jgi:pSer/pThr/pTyr-binding forkhead associated (FHA) protein
MASQAFLKIVSGSKEGLNVVLPEKHPLVIGRRQGDLIIDDPMVSGRHVQIVFENDGWHLQDLGSTNGTMVDGRLVRDMVLRPGSEITLGSTRMVLFVSTEREGDSEKRTVNSKQLEIAWLLDEELVELSEESSGERMAGDVVGQDLRLPPGVNAVLEVVAGADLGKVYRFTRGNVSIGRRIGEVPLTDVEVSRRHAVVEVFGRQMIFLRDLGSTNGTYHNGRKVSLAQLEPGDTVGVGKTVLKLQLTR